MSPEPDCAVVSGMLRPYEMSEVGALVLMAKAVEPRLELAFVFMANHGIHPYRSSAPRRL